MGNYIGSVVSLRKEPIIYFIKMGNYIYIGKTEQHPVIRWGKHLSKTGTFIEKINQIDRGALIKLETIKFYAFECRYIKNNVKEVQVGDAVRLTEYYLHVMVKSTVNTINRKIGENIRLISDVSRTTPKYFRDKGCEQLAREILDEFLNVCAV